MFSVNYFASNLKLSPKLFFWVKILSKFISLQILVQLIGAATGIYIIRYLSKEEYAFFTIANNINATLNILSNLGISAALLAVGSNVWEDKYKFGQLINSTIRLRYLLAAIAIITCLPPMLWLLIISGSSIAYTTLITILVLIGLNFQLTAVVLRTIPKLHSQIIQLQQVDLIQASARLLVILITSLIYLNAALTVLATTIACGVEKYLLQRWFNKYIDASAPNDNSVRQSVIKIVKNHAPESVFYTFQGQIQLWLIGIFGTTANIAEVGALSRLAMLFSVISSVIANIIVPSFSRYQSRRILQIRYIQVVSILGVIAVTLITLSILFPTELLWLLGGQYSYLKAAVFWIVLGSTLNTCSSTLWQMNAAKGWVDYAWTNIPITIFLQIGLLVYVDVTSVHGVLIFSFLSGLPWLGINILITWYKLFHSVR